jgi:hypothetical protein
VIQQSKALDRALNIPRSLAHQQIQTWKTLRKRYMSRLQRNERVPPVVAAIGLVYRQLHSHLERSHLLKTVAYVLKVHDQAANALSF